MLEHLVSGLSKGIIMVGDEATRGIEVAKKELNPEFIAVQSQVKAKVALMKREYKKHNAKAGKSNVDLLAAQAMQKWVEGQRQADKMANDMMAEFLAEDNFEEVSPQPQQATAFDLLSQLTPEQLQSLMSKATQNVG